MAICQKIVENKVAVNYHGVVVYHTHRGNNIDNPPNDYIFSVAPYGNEEDVGGAAFDIRTLQTYDAQKNVYANLLNAIDEGCFGDTNLNEREGGGVEYAGVEDGAKANTCPVCGAHLSASDENIWGDGELTDDGDFYEYNCQCPRCCAALRQVYRLTFDGFETL